jgi:PPOX class probable F420-dependent enzyme
MTLTAEAHRRIADDHVVWLTTVSDSGAPVTNPVWCALDGDDIVAFTTADAVRVRNIERRPLVSLNFNSDALGGDLVIISGRATVRPGRPSAIESYRRKYEAAMRDLHQMTLEQFDAMFDREIRVRPLKVRPQD